MLEWLYDIHRNQKHEKDYHQTKKARMQNYGVSHRSQPLLPLFTRSKVARGRLSTVQLLILSPDQIERLSVCEVKHRLLTHKEASRCATLSDQNMGPASRSDAHCGTCLGTFETCPGHFGHIRLARPVYNIFFIDMIVRLLRSVCFYCGHLLLEPQDRRWRVIDRLTPGERLARIAKCSEGIAFCGGNTCAASAASASGSGATSSGGGGASVGSIWSHDKRCGRPQPVFVQEELVIACFVRPETKRRGSAVAAAAAGDMGCPQIPLAASRPRTPTPSRPRTPLTPRTPRTPTRPCTPMSPVSPARPATPLIDKEEEDKDDDDEKEEIDEIHTTPKEPEEETEEEQENNNDIEEASSDRDSDCNEEEEETQEVEEEETSAAGEEEEPEPEIEQETEEKVMPFDRRWDAEDHIEEGKRGHRHKIKGQKIYFTPEEAWAVLRRIRDQDVEKLGFSRDSRPENTILRVFPVSPPSLRVPNFCPKTGSSNAKNPQGETDATKLLKKILDTNSHLEYCLEKKQQILDGCNNNNNSNKNNPSNNDTSNQLHPNKTKLKPETLDQEQLKRLENDCHYYFTLLQQVCAAYICNTGKRVTPYTKAHNKAPYQSIAQGWGDKYGLVRGILVCKRVNDCGRDVIGPARNFDIDEVGIPIFICMTLKYPERVSPTNIHKLQELVYRGPDVYPGALNIVTREGELINLQFARRRRTTLRYGDIVERHIQRGDIVILNRQPSLHDMSMMAHRVVPVDGLLMLLPVSCCKPYAADYDGDEMNLHVPQTEEARAEALYLMAVPKFLTVGSISLVQDALLSAYILTGMDILEPLDRAYMMWSKATYFQDWMAQSQGRYPIPALWIQNETNGKWTPMYTGKQIFSWLLPPDFHHLSSCPNWSEIKEVASLEEQTLLLDGQLWIGRITGELLGPREASLVRRLVFEHGAEYTRKFLSDAQRVLNGWLSEYGFSIGGSDLLAPHKKEITHITQRVCDSLKQWSLPAQHAVVQEQHTQRILKACVEHTNALVLKDPTNRIFWMFKSGARGTLAQACQGIGTLGPQSLSGGRLAPHEMRDRVLPHFPSYCLDPKARGMVTTSFVDGLDPLDSFAHSCASSEGLVASSTQTSRTGYAQRRKMRLMENIIIHHDGTVRDGVQCLALAFGDDGLDPRFVDHEILDVLYMNRTKAETHLSAAAAATRDWSSICQKPWEPHWQTVLQEEFEYVFALIGELRRHRLYLDTRQLDAKIQTPVHFQRLLRMVAREQQHQQQHGKPETAVAAIFLSDLTPPQVVARIRAFWEQLYASVHYRTSLLSIKALFFTSLNCRQILGQYRLTQVSFEKLLQQIERRFFDAWAEPMTPVGLRAAQSIGAPCCQMTLQSTHKAGGDGYSVSKGLPRYEECLRATPRTSFAAMEIYLLPSHRDPAAVQQIVSAIQPVYLNQVIISQTMVAAEWPGETQYEQNMFQGYQCLYTILPLQKKIRTRQAPKSKKKLQQIPEKKSNPTPPIKQVGYSQQEMRLVLDKTHLLQLSIPIKRVLQALREAFREPKTHHLWMASGQEDPEWIIRIRFYWGSEDMMKKCKGMALPISPLHEAQAIRSIVEKRLSMGLLHGVSGIRSVYITQTTYIPDDPNEPSCREPLLITRGSNLRRIWAIRGIDASRTITNNFEEVQKVMGIESASVVLLKEIQSTLEPHGIHIDYHYLQLLVKSMSSTGWLIGATRQGFNREMHIGWLRRASFEQTNTVLEQAAARGEADPLTGNTNNLVVGAPIPVGTYGTFALVPDTKKAATQKVFLKKRPCPVINQISPQDLVRLIPPLEPARDIVPQPFSTVNTALYAQYRNNIRREAQKWHIPEYEAQILPPAIAAAAAASSSKPCQEVKRAPLARPIHLAPPPPPLAAPISKTELPWEWTEMKTYPHAPQRPIQFSVCVSRKSNNSPEEAVWPGW